jgi:hypothetical protein
MNLPQPDSGPDSNINSPYYTVFTLQGGAINRSRDSRIWTHQEPCFKKNASGLQRGHDLPRTLYNAYTLNCSISITPFFLVKLVLYHCPMSFKDLNKYYTRSKFNMLFLLLYAETYVPNVHYNDFPNALLASTLFYS